MKEGKVKRREVVWREGEGRKENRRARETRKRREAGKRRDERMAKT